MTDNISKDDKQALLLWDSSKLRKKLRSVRSREAKELIGKLLVKDPDERCKSFRKNGEGESGEEMLVLLDDPYFNDYEDRIENPSMYSSPRSIKVSLGIKQLVVDPWIGIEGRRVVPVG